MAVATPAAGNAARESVRSKRERDQELLVWPDLVFVEFICAVIFTIAFVVLSTVVNAPLLNRANAGITPDPSKAPWYFMNLQELLLHMDPGLAGVIVPTILLIALMAVPYIDRSNDGQGGWFATPNAVRITMFSFVYSSLWITWLILWDNKSHTYVYKNLPEIWGSDRQFTWPGDMAPFGHRAVPATETAPEIQHKAFADVPGVGGLLDAIWDFIFIPDRVGLRDGWQWRLPVPFQPGSGPHDGYLDWPQDFRNVPVPGNGTWLFHWGEPTWMPGWLDRIYPYDAHLDIPEITVQYILPIIAMIGLPIIMILILKKLKWVLTTRDVMISLFTGFILVYLALTIVGVAFRGKSQALVPAHKVPDLHKDPSIYRRAAPPSDYGLIDIGTGTHG